MIYRQSHILLSKLLAGARSGGAAAVVLGIGISTAQAASTTISFGVQHWQGLTVKTEVVTELLQAMGYKVEKKHLVTPMILRALAQDDLDVSLGGWYPGAAYEIDPLAKKGKIIKLTTNISDALSGLAVPDYVHQAGVDNIKDLNKCADRFQHKIYGIEPGSSANKDVQDVIDANKFNLGNWKLVSSNTAVMLTAVGRKVDRHKWIVFYAWKPHWMNKVYNLYYLKSHQKSFIVNRKSVVFTLVNRSFPKRHPNITHMLKQFKVSAKTQTEWIYDYSYKNNNKPAQLVAHNWIASHPAVVRSWLTGVKTAQGQPAFAAIKASFDFRGSD